VELIVAQGASTETSHFITKQENYILSHWYLQGTWQVNVPQHEPKTQIDKTLR
jgi:hypothetical protein